MNLISRNDFISNKNHRVCSAHFPGGEKTYLNNLSLIVPKTTRPTIPTPRTTTKLRNRVLNITQNINNDVQQEEQEENVDPVKDLERQIAELKAKHALEMGAATSVITQLRKNVETLDEHFLLTILKLTTENFIFTLDSQTMLTDYETFKVMFDSFGPAVDKLIYHHSDTNVKRLNEDSCKRGPKCSIRMSFFDIGKATMRNVRRRYCK